MDSKRWRRARELFERATELPLDARAPFLDEACADDPELRPLVERLVEGDEAAPSILDAPRDVLLERLGEIADAPPPTRLGPYELGEEVGRGGMGTVYLARRADGSFDRTVALKVVRGGLGSTHAARRFRSEGRILAGLEHPNIARLYDAGVEGGRAYLVMELVNGQSLDAHCDARQLDVDQRLDLFLQVCEAVGYAHRNLVVHRDLKPSNIMVTEEGSVRLLDFGISRLLEEGDDEAPATRTGRRALTPEYASPEQLRAAPVTTASDVYSLGVVLYELLTGTRPYASPPADAIPVTGEDEATKPSLQVLDPSANRDGEHVAESPEARAANRGTTPGGLSKRLRGDLDTIVLMVIRRDPSRRYASVGAVADDIRRHRKGLPVAARPDTLGYRTRTFVRRHAVGVVAGSAVMVGLAVGLAVAVWQARIASEQRDVARLEAEKAGRVSDFLSDVFLSTDPSEMGADSLTGTRLLALGANRLETELVLDPDVQTAVQDVIGTVFANLSRFEEAGTLLRGALDRRIAAFGPESAEAGLSTRALALLARERESPEADSLFRRSAAILSAALGPDHPEVAETLVQMTHVVIGTDRDSADALLDEALRIYRAAPGDHGVAIAAATYQRGFVHHAWGEYDTAERLYRDALGVQLERLGPRHPFTLTTQHNLGFLLQVAGRYAAADTALRAVLDARREVYGERHARVANSLHALSELRHAEGKYREAEELIREALRLRIDLFDAGDGIVTGTRLFLATILNARGRVSEAEALFEELIAGLEARGGSAVGLARSLNNFAGVLESQGDFAGAESLYRRAHVLYAEALGDTHPFTAIVQGNVASALHEQGDLDAAEPLYRGALAALRDAYSDDHPSVAGVRMQLGVLVRQRGDPSSAEPLLRAAEAALVEALPSGHWRIAQARTNLGGLLVELGGLAEAERQLLSARDALEPRKGIRRRDWGRLLAALVDLYTALDRPEAAARYRALARSAEVP